MSATIFRQTGAWGRSQCGGMRLLCCFCFLFIPPPVATAIEVGQTPLSETPVVNRPSEPGVFGGRIYRLMAGAQYLESERDALHFETLLSEDDDSPWDRIYGDQLQIESPEIDYWLRTSVELGDEASASWIASLTSNRLYSVRWWIVQDGQVLGEGRDGLASPPEEGRPRSLYFSIPIPEGTAGSVELIVRARTLWKVPLGIQIMSRSDYLLVGERFIIFVTSWASILTGLLLYNLIIFASTRNRSYGYYCAFLSCTIFFVVGSSGYGRFMIWPELVRFDLYGTRLASNGIALFASLFALDFLSIAKVSRGATLSIRALIGISLFGLCAALVEAYQVSVVTTLLATLLLYPVLIASGVIAQRRGREYARFFVISWLPVSTCMVLYALAQFGVIENDRWLGLITLMSFVAEGLLLSTALGDRINSMRINVLKLNTELATSRNELEVRVQERTRELVNSQRELVAAARDAGMAQIASEVLHSAGNSLTSITITIGLLHERIRGWNATALSRVVGLIESHSDDLPEYLNSDDKGRKVIGFLRALSDQSLEVRQGIGEQVSQLTLEVKKLTAQVTSQRKYADANTLSIECQLYDVVEQVLCHDVDERFWSGVELVRHYSDVPAIDTDPYLLRQILSDVLSNAQWAMEASSSSESRVVLSLECTAGSMIQISITDNGVGIDPVNLSAIFRQGFTTRTDATGGRLHAAANFAVQLGGTLRAESDGVGRGAKFILEIPIEA